jgi:transmembrane sensor
MILETEVGKQNSFTLQEGSVVFLNTNSKVSVAMSRGERHIELVRGEARFEVATDTSRPFTVVTSTASVRALGTLFNVRAETLFTQVAVLEGQVQVTAASPGKPPAGAQVADSDGSVAPRSPAIERVRLAAGERAEVTETGIQTNTGPPIEAVAAWTQRRLVFRDQTLGVVIHEFNRYRTRPLVLNDPALALLRISGAFNSDDPDSLLTYRSIYETVRIEHRSDGSERLFRDSAGAVGQSR